MSDIQIKTALISVFHKDGLDEIIHLLHNNGVTIYSTGGTFDFIESLSVPVQSVESLTGYPSILDGRVKTLHPGVFGAILAKRESDHLSQLKEYNIPLIDLVVVDLYPFEKTVRLNAPHDEIIEKIDIGGISLIRAAAKNYKDVVIIPSRNEYGDLLAILENQNGLTDIDLRKKLASRAFGVSSYYDSKIYNYFSDNTDQNLRLAMDFTLSLRYGENPHQNAAFYGDINEVFTQLSGKELSYNNILDIDAAVQIMHELGTGMPAFAVIKHNNACGVAIRNSVFGAWKAALAGDPVSAFGGVLISNSKVDFETAKDIHELFYEVLIAPDFDLEGLELLKTKNRIILKIKLYPEVKILYRSALNGLLMQQPDLSSDERGHYIVKTNRQPDERELDDMQFAISCVKHLKSNAIVFVKNKQLLGMGCGQTSRVDACKQAIVKAKAFGFDLNGSVMASDAFFPFPDCVELAFNEGVNAVIQPGGSVKDHLSIDFCNAHNMSMVFTGIRHFKH